MSNFSPNNFPIRKVRQYLIEIRAPVENRKFGTLPMRREPFLNLILRIHLKGL